MDRKIWGFASWHFVAAGFIFGLWLYSSYREGGFTLMVAEGWKGLILGLAFLGLVVVWNRVTKK